ncbi:MAG TPA: hydantoinase/oxoprolinase family protein [Candidatus Binatia bacterium]|nr:hydantoinase/oxoprolinase family protein [Candidatus Binatia bacterium]
MSNETTATLRVAFDIGGTFTDVVVAGANGRLFTYKILTLPDSVGADVGRCVADALSQQPGGHVASLVHGTTIASNAVLEGKGAITGLITTRGFRDELEIRRLGRPGVYDVFWERTPPLIPRRRRLEVSERMTVNGEVDTPLAANDVREALGILRSQGVEAVAVSFLHSYVNPAHERQATALIRELLPEVMVCASSEVLPEIREYERTSTTALNAYLMPVVNRYLDQLEVQLQQYHPSLLIMQSNGGVMTTEHARRRPVHMIESGPAAGVLAAASLAREIGLSQAVAFDMGGTTVKACLIENGQPVETAEGEVGAGINVASRLSRGAGYALRVPAYDIVEVGAGGGSLAWVDEGGALRVGPRSAGAVPGPACYGRGGTAPTITDANVILGYMNPQKIAGGTVPIDAGAARTAIEKDLCARLGLTVQNAAYGVHQVANATMMRAIRAVTTERGRDPREFSLIAFGGAGPIHAAELATSLGIGRVYVPLFPGLFSALGLLLADLRYDYVQSVPGRLDAVDPASLLREFDTLAARVREEVFREEINPTGVQLDRFIDLRYARQSSELTLKVPEAVAAAELPRVLAESFHSEHERTYGYRREHDPIAVVSLRLKATAPARSVGFRELGESFARTVDEAGTPEITRRAYFGPQAGEREARILRRSDLVGKSLTGPLIVEEFDTTVVVPPAWQAEVEGYGNILLKSQR